MNEKNCGDCKHFTGSGDWNLCCTIHHPTQKEKEEGIEFPFGHLCYADTDACDMFEERSEEQRVNDAVRTIRIFQNDMLAACSPSKDATKYVNAAWLLSEYANKHTKGT